MAIPACLCVRVCVSVSVYVCLQSVTHLSAISFARARASSGDQRATSHWRAAGSGVEILPLCSSCLCCPSCRFSQFVLHHGCLLSFFSPRSVCGAKWAVGCRDGKKRTKHSDPHPPTPPQEKHHISSNFLINSWLKTL